MIIKESGVVNILDNDRLANQIASIPVYLGMSSNVLSASEVTYLTAYSDNWSEPSINEGMLKTNKFFDLHANVTCDRSCTQQEIFENNVVSNIGGIFYGRRPEEVGKDNRKLFDRRIQVCKDHKIRFLNDIRCKRERLI